MIFMVNNRIWKLKFVNASNKNLRRSDNSFTPGATDGLQKTVFILDNMSDYMTDKVILHEVAHVHAIEYNYSIPIEIEEIVCDFLSLYGRGVVRIADKIMSHVLMMAA